MKPILLLSTLFFAVAANANPAGSALEPIQDWRSSLPAPSSPHEQAIVQVRNASLSLSENKQFLIEYLHGSLLPIGANQAVALENLATFQVRIDQASIRISDKVLQALVQSELEATNAPLRIKQVMTQPGSIQINGDIKRLGLWIPFSMEGIPTVLNGSEVALQPRTLKVAGVPVYKALLATNIQLQSLIDMQSKAVSLQGQSMVLRLQHVLPAPRLAFALSNLELDQGEVQLGFGQPGAASSYYCKEECPNNFVYTEGGELRAAGMVLSGNPTLLTGTEKGVLPIAMHKLDQLTSNSTIQLRADGALWISAQEGVLNPEDTVLLNTGEKVVTQLERMLGNERDQSVTLAVHHATLLSKEGVELRVEKLLARTDSTNLGQLPASAQTVHVGEIIVGEKALNTLMNKALFNYEDSPIRNIRSTIGEPQLELALQVKPQIFGIPLVWLPATLHGELLISEDQQHLEFTPTAVRMFGVSTLPIIEYLGWQLDTLIKIDETAVKLQGNTIRIALNQAMPPLQLNTRLQAIKPVLRSPLGAYLHVHVGTQAPEKIGEIYNTMEMLPLGLWMNTPEFTALGMRTGPTLGHVYNSPRSERLMINLAQYPDLLEAATLRLPRNERVWVNMPGHAATALQHESQGHRHEDQTHQIPHHHQ